MDFLDIRKKAEERAGARAAEPDDARFTTWRPGTGAPPVVAAPVPEPAVQAVRDEDFLVVGPAGTLSAAPGPHPATGAPPAPVEPERTADPLDDFFYRPDEAAPALPLVASPGETPPEERAALPPEEYLTFLLGAEEYALAIERVQEVVRAPPIAEVPRAPAHVLGVVSVRGEIMAVVDPRARIGLPPAGPAGGHEKVVVVDAGEGRCALLVDRVASVVRVRQGSIEPCPQGVAGHRGELLAGIGRVGARLFTVLDLGALLRGDPERGGGLAGSPPRARRADAGA